MKIINLFIAFFIFSTMSLNVYADHFILLETGGGSMFLGTAFHEANAKLEGFNNDPDKNQAIFVCKEDWSNSGDKRSEGDVITSSDPTDILYSGDTGQDILLRILKENTDCFTYTENPLSVQLAPNANFIGSLEQGYIGCNCQENQIPNWAKK